MAERGCSCQVFAPGGAAAGGHLCRSRLTGRALAIQASNKHPAWILGSTRPRRSSLQVIRVQIPAPAPGDGSVAKVECEGSTRELAYWKALTMGVSKHSSLGSRVGNGPTSQAYKTSRFESWAPDRGGSSTRATEEHERLGPDRAAILQNLSLYGDAVRGAHQ